MDFEMSAEERVEHSTAGATAGRLKGFGEDAPGPAARAERSIEDAAAARNAVA